MMFNRLDVAARARHGVSLVLCLVLAGCAVGPDYIRPAIEVPAEFAPLAGWKQAEPGLPLAGEHNRANAIAAVVAAAHIGVDFTTSLAALSTDIYLPSLPSIAGALETSAAEVQLTLSLFMVGFALGQIVYGPL